MKQSVEVSIDDPATGLPRSADLGQSPAGRCQLTLDLYEVDDRIAVIVSRSCHLAEPTNDVFQGCGE